VYTEFFGLNEKPFSISPDPRYLYLSARHADALAHLIYGISESGGFIQLTGEVGTGKTTLIRSLLEQLPEKAEIALILNPQLSTREFMQSISSELRIPEPTEKTVKGYIDALNAKLLAANADDRRVVLIVDEAQTLSPELLEQVRLLTNLETAKKKLLQIILIGQPELKQLLDRPEMRQIAQRVTGRYHLEPLSQDDATVYIRHRMKVAGAHAEVFAPRAVRQIYRLTGGIPRLINVVADRALLAAYTQERTQIDAKLVRRAAAEVFGKSERRPWWPWAAAAAGLAVFAVTTTTLRDSLLTGPEAAGPGGTAFANAAAGSTERSAPGSPSRSAPDGAGVPRGASTAGGAAGASDATAGDAAQSARDGSEADTAHDGAIREGSGAGEDASLPGARAAGRSDPGADAAALGRTLPATEPAATAAAGKHAVVSLETLLDDPGFPLDSVAAMSTLFDLWNVAYEPARGPACNQASTQQLKCLFTTRSSIGELRRRNLPAILTLTDTDGGTHQVVVSGIGYDTAELRVADRTEHVGIVDLTHYWYGDQLLLWKPIGVGDDIQPGMRAESVAWIRSGLASLRGVEPSSDDTTLYDAELETWVREYQRARRLGVDGVVGTQTQIALQLDLGAAGIPQLEKAL
jgi:general secretion pathway protein A